MNALLNLFGLNKKERNIDFDVETLMCQIDDLSDNEILEILESSSTDF